MPHNLVIGGCSFSDVCEKIVGMNKSVLHSHLWRSRRHDSEIFLYVQGNHFIKVESEQYLIVVLGHLSNKAGDVGEVALRKIEHDLHHNPHLLVGEFEGAFSLIVVDKSAGKIGIYRNICGIPNIFYTRTKRLTLFSDSLSYLAWIVSTVLNEKLLLNDSQLPYYFLYTRCFDSTLFSGIRSLMPGEQVCFDKGTEFHLQRMRIGDIAGSHPNDCKEALEHVMKKIMAEYVATYPDIVNIFSGGVDSSYIQAHLSQLVDRTIRTFSIAVVHPSRAWQAEYNYALSGSDFFKSDHTFVRITPPEYPDLLLNTISELALPPTTQGPSAIKLWKAVKKSSSTALMGVAADTLFGMTQELEYIDRAMLFEKLIPFKRFREILPNVGSSLPLSTEWQEKLARFLKPSMRALRLDLHDTMSPMHPFNMTEPVLLEATSKLFGYHEVAKMIHKRQAQMNYYNIHGSLKECLHALLLLNVGMLDAEEFYGLASYVGVRVVFPFLDSRMIKTVLSMGDSRFSFGSSKKVIKSALRRYLPKELVYRKKTGWGFPVSDWMSRGGALYPLLQEARAGAFTRPKNGMDTRSDALDWFLLCFNLWHRLFLDKQRELLVSRQKGFSI